MRKCFNQRFPEQNRKKETEELAGMRRNRRRKRAMQLLLLVLAATAVIAGLLIFRVRKVNVYGNNRCAASGISEGLMDGVLGKNTLYLLWRYRDGEVPDTLPYLSALKVKMKSPYEIEVEVAEKELVGYVDKGEHAYFDGEGIVLDITDETYAELPVITGADVEEPVLYQKLPTTSSAQLRTILSITQLLRQQKLTASEVRFGENGDITVYVNGVEAMLGQDEYMEEKIANLRAILEKTDGKNGTLHLESFTGKNDAVTFRVSEETETEASAGVEHTGGEAGAEEGEAAEAENPDGTPGAENPDGAPGAENPDGAPGAENTGENGQEEQEQSSSAVIPMVFDSTGTLVYNVHVENGTVVDANGNPVSGCLVNEDGYIVDAYMNRFDPKTGELVQ